MALRSSKIGFEGLIVGIQALDVGFEEPRHAWGGQKPALRSLKEPRTGNGNPSLALRGRCYALWGSS